MVTSLLVGGDRIENGRKLITGLVRDGLDVAVAFWVGMGERGPWHLYIASRHIVPGRLGDIPQRIYEQLKRIANPAVEFSQVRLIPATDPAARDAIEHRDRQLGSSRPVEVFGHLGDLAVEWAYIYERISAALTREEVIQKVVSLMDRSGPQQPSKVTLRGGTVIQGIPVGLLMQAPGGEIVVSILDTTTGTPDYIPATDVANIE
jgi:hypothetical protein